MWGGSGCGSSGMLVTSFVQIPQLLFIAPLSVCLSTNELLLTGGHVKALIKNRSVCFVLEISLFSFDMFRVFCTFLGPN